MHCTEIEAENAGLIAAIDQAQSEIWMELVALRDELADLDRVERALTDLLVRLKRFSLCCP